MSVLASSSKPSRPWILTVISSARGVIADAASQDAPVLDPSGLTVAPGLIDLQVNGACGIDITAEPERLWDVATELPRWRVM